MKRNALLIMIGLLVCVALVGVSAPLKVGICKIVEHPALDAVEQGAIDALTAAGYEDGVDVEYLLASAQGDYTVAISIAQNFRAQGVDFVVAIATATAQAAAEVFRGTDVPVIYAAITDPVGALLVPDATDPSGNENITGVSDMINVADDIRLLQELSDEIDSIGIVYNPGEANSVVLTDMAREAAEALGLSLIAASADTSANVPIAAQSLIGRVDALYVTTDNTVVSAIDSVLAVSREAKIPFLVADPTSLASATLAVGFDYYDLGLTAGDLVLRILDGARPNEIPVTFVSGAGIHLNVDEAILIEFEFPASVVERASSVLYGGVSFTKNEE
ncbi:ABC transporter substrate-binding protein [Candidatus Bipolaricaulota bacterium]|nr:ABC transporter substrate-binding protein [Candidatus Bipolaricaulota bacterium]